jgi:NAD(P)-dependent dehydrogenase (short-subunit alcohol dehydrogenase family)
VTENGGRFEGKVVVIIGAAGGIGRAASEGARIVAVDLPNAGLDETVAAVTQAGGTAFAVAADVTKYAEVEH